ncbi:unnamed protein product [Adineta steineri]|uniref:Uncharacterized protein n=1 Tax=Adineta steineri TaxID=433720 RepID=A0A818T6W1_9BILA|nr:unnamed protein product [Adineta steineri]
MTVIKSIPSTNQSATSKRMKKIFIILCILLCIITFILYSRTILNWTFLHQIITNKIQKSQYSLPENRRFAIFACSIHSYVKAYAFYAPLTAASWQRIGYQPIVIFVGDFKKLNVLTGRLNLSRNYLKHLGAHVLDFQCPESYSIKLSQLVRVFSGFLPIDIVQDEDYILTTDSDLWPLDASRYKPTPGTNGFIFNAFCCGTFKRRGRNYKMYPMGHIFLQKKVWRAIVMESKQRTELLVNADNHTLDLLSENNASFSFDTITLYGRHEFKGVYDKNMDKGDEAWYMDQVLCSMLLIDYLERHPTFNISERNRGDRLDRADLFFQWNRDEFNQFNDAHLKHDEMLEANNWKIFNKLLKFLFSGPMVTLFNDYYQQYLVLDKMPRPPQQGTFPTRRTTLLPK